MSLLDKLAVPALPVPNRDYSPTYMGQLLNVLRIFFNGLLQRFNALAGTHGGRFIECPTGEFYSTVDQPIAIVDTAQVVAFATTRASTGVGIAGASDSQITVDYSGIYYIQFHGQVVSNSATAKIAIVWANVDGTPIANSAREYTFAGNATEIEVTWAIVVRLDAGSYVEIEWAANDTDVALDAIAATSPHPGIPSASVSIFLVSSSV